MKGLKTTYRNGLRRMSGLKRMTGRVLPRLDRYIMKKFIGTYIFSIILIISISIVFDYN